MFLKSLKRLVDRPGNKIESFLSINETEELDT